jgi:hypothetical protein
MSAPRTNDFVRSKLKETAKVAALLAKISALQAGKPNAFNVDFNGKRFFGEKMSNLDLTTDPTKITFTYEAVNYELLLSDIKIIKRIRCRKYMFKTKVLTNVTP